VHGQQAQQTTKGTLGQESPLILVSTATAAGQLQKVVKKLSPSNLPFRVEKPSLKIKAKKNELKECPHCPSRVRNLSLHVARHHRDKLRVTYRRK
jgi:hypothetical protein